MQENFFLNTVLKYDTTCVSVLSEILTIDSYMTYMIYSLFIVRLLTCFICNPEFKFNFVKWPLSMKSSCLSLNYMYIVSICQNILVALKMLFCYTAKHTIL